MYVYIYIYTRIYVYMNGFSPGGRCPPPGPPRHISFRGYIMYVFVLKTKEEEGDNNNPARWWHGEG